MKTKYLFLTPSVLTLVLSLITFTAMPAATLAATTSSNDDPVATINADSLIVDSGERARLDGTAEDVKKVRITITAENSKKELFKSSSLKVKDGEWKTSVKKKLKNGTYTVTVYDTKIASKNKLTTGTLTVGKPPAVLKVSSVPLLGGGTASPNTIVPISYLQVTNTGTATTTVKGFWVKQNGSASVSVITGFSSVDDKGGSRASVGGDKLFKKNEAFVPSDNAVLAPGQRKLFTVKTQLGASSGNAAGNTLMLDVIGIDAQGTISGAFPIRGTTWTLTR